MSNNLPNKFTIPEDRIPRPWSQIPYGCCVAASITKVLEVINYVKTGTYTMFSKGFTYGMHSRPGKKEGGMDYNYTIPRLLECGTVPEEMYTELDEIPYICEKLKNDPRFDELVQEAKKTKIKSYEKIPGNIYFMDNVKKILFEKQMPLVGNMVGKSHCVVIVGWDGKQLLYHDHNGRKDLYHGKCNCAYYLEGYTDDPEPEKEETDTFKEITEISDILDILESKTIVTNRELWDEKCKTDINVYWLCRKVANYLIMKGENI